MTAKTYDAIIIGGGHNGLVCACDLAHAGFSVRVLERRHVLGGAAVTEEFHPGFRNSTASYTVSLLHPSVIKDLNLAEHGLRIVERPISNFLPLPDGRYLKVGPDLQSTQAEVAKFSSADAAKLPDYYAMLDRAVGLLRHMLLRTPPNVGEHTFATVADWWSGLDLARQVRRLDLVGKRDLLDLFTKSAGDLLDSWFESAPIKAAFGFDSIVGNYAGPYAAGSAYVLLHHVFGEVNGKPGLWGHAIGGMGAITQAMAREAERRGVELSTDAPVQRVCVEGGRACGVLLESGERIDARAVVANVGPKLLFNNLVERSDLPADFAERIDRFRTGSGTFRMNVALSGLPEFTALPGTGLHQSAGIILAPSLLYMEEAWFDARREGFSRSPIVEIVIPSTLDETLAPKGQHVASLFCQQFAPRLDPVQFPDGWDGAREAAADAIFSVIEHYAPNFRSLVLARQIHSPTDLERKFGLVDGDIFHGALSLDQLYSARPVLGHADYRAPIKNLFMCGAGTHPGGGVTGLPGRNAAREIVRSMKK